MNAVEQAVIEEFLIPAVKQIIAERDRYREALERITTIGKFHCKCCAAHVQIATKALRGGEVENDH